MDYSRKISERQWNLPEKGELESRRETTYIIATKLILFNFCDPWYSE